MKRQFVIGALGCTLFFAALTATAEVKVTLNHNQGDQATAAFKFKEVPPPSKINAASHAKFTIVDGEKDPNGAELDALHDGKLPAEQDEPASNFFFKDDTEGGRIAIDLGTVIDVKQINTYSWHTDTRAPQVYSLYAADGTATNFDVAPAKQIDPTTRGWKLIANVDTRPKNGEPGGQYGVSISDSNGSLGKYRYLLLAVSRTESDDAFGNTFFSEINVIDSSELLASPSLKPAGDQPGVKILDIDHGKYSAVIDTTETPDLTDWANNTLAPVVAEWYPKLVAMLPSEEYSAPAHFSITFKAEKAGEKDWVAYTIGNRISGSHKFYINQLKNEAVGSIIHEMVHVVQQYKHAPRSAGWLVEGIPDYIRWYDFEPKSNGAAISKRGYDKARYDGMYRISANFLNYVSQKYDKNLVKEVNAALRQGKYNDDMFVKLTGKNLDDLNTEWKADLAKKLGIQPVPAPAPK